MQQTNFGKNLTWTPAAVYRPSTEQQVLDILARHRGQRIRCVGRRHSWSRILEADGVLLDLRQLDGVAPEANGDELFVRVGAGCQIKRLLHELDRQRGWTLPSVGFITEQSVAGAISTGTHGSGRHSLSHYVISLRVARYDRATGVPVIEEVDGGPELEAARCSLGCVGVVLNVTMQCLPKYLVEEHFREYAMLADVLASEVHYPLQQFYLVPWRWSYIVQHRRESQGPRSYGAMCYLGYRFLMLDLAMHWLILLVVRLLRLPLAVKAVFRWIAPSFVVKKWRVVAPANSQLVMEHELFRHTEIELFVTRKQLPEALGFLQNALMVAGSRDITLHDEFQRQLNSAKVNADFEQVRGRYCHHYPICIRKVCQDATLISMTSQPGSEPRGGSARPADADDAAWYAITLTNYHRGKSRRPFEEFAYILANAMASLFDARPHWGKLCPLPAAELRRLYPSLEQFQEICTRVDSDGAFRNRWLDELLSKPPEK